MRTLLLLATLALSTPALAQDPPTHNLRNLTQVHELRCDALHRGKQAQMKADIWRGQAGHSGQDIGNIIGETNVSQYESEAGAAFDEAGGLKRQLQRMVETFVGEHRALWYQTVDQARKIQLEDMITFAQGLLEGGCAKN